MLQNKTMIQQHIINKCKSKATIKKLIVNPNIISVLAVVEWEQWIWPNVGKGNHICDV